MQKFTVHKGLVAPMDRENVDTDAIIPKQFLKSIKKTGFGPNLFDEWRYLDQPGQPGVPDADRKPNPEFELNQPSFADIFFNNRFKNGLLPIVRPEATIDQLFNDVAAFPGYELTIDLERQVILRPQGEEIAFDVIAFRKYCLLNGFDDIGLTMRHADKIKAFEAERLAQKPWLAHTLLQK